MARGGHGLAAPVKSPIIAWANPVDGAFEAGANWAGGAAPGTGDIAYLDDASAATPYAVTASTSQTVAGLDLDAGATLDITAGTFQTDGPGPSVTSAGTIAITGGSLLVTTSIVNTGTLAMGGGADNGSLLLDASGIVLSGGGTVTLTTHGLIDAEMAGVGLVNVDNTITGGGGIEHLAFSNGADGVVDATTGMLIQTFATVSNAGLIESTADNLTVYDTTVDGSAGGVVAADGASAVILLYGSDFIGGTLEAKNGGAIYTEDNASTLDGSASAVTVQGSVEILDGDVLTLLGEIDNSGTLTLRGANHHAGLAIGAVGATLTGGGVITLDSTSYIEGLAAGATLTNVHNTISGNGFIISPLVIVNQAAGVIDAVGGRMVLKTQNTVANNGLIEAGGPGGILLVTDSTIDSSGGGTVEAAGTIQLNGATVLGGVLTIDKGGVLVSEALASTVDLAGGMMANAGILEGAGGGLTVDGDVANTGLVIAESGALTITGDVTGTGKVEVFGKGTLEIDGAQAGTVAFGAGATGKLILGDSQAFTGAVTGFSKTGANQIDLNDITYDASDSVAYSAKTHALTVDTADGTVLATVTLKGSYAGSTFTLSYGGAEGTVITDPRTMAFASAAAGFGGAGASSATSAFEPAARLSTLLAHG